MSAVCVVQHVPSEPPGIIAEALRSCGVPVLLVRVHQGDRVPRRMAAFSGLVVMGGPMGVYDQAQYPFLRQELRLIENALSERRPILGVCLGSQLLAAALGAPVTRGCQKEIGWHPVTLGRAAAHDVLWADLPESFVAFHWHGDVFELPRGAAPLAWSRLTDYQAFRHGDSAYGILFHQEVTERIIARMTRTFRHELREVGLSEGRLLDEVPVHLPPLQAIGRTVFRRWAALVKGEHDAEPGERMIQARRVQEPPAPDDGARCNGTMNTPASNWLPRAQRARRSRTHRSGKEEVSA
jgi:GMP synthase (glutamine-hydrolysing)